MEVSEIRRAFYTLMTDARHEKRDAAQALLGGNGDRMNQELARIAATIFDVLRGAKGPDALQGALDWTAGFPLSSSNNRYWETVGQVLIEAGNAEGGARDAGRRERLLDFGLMFISRAQNGGFRLSAFTLEKVRGMQEHGSLKDLAGGILDYESMISPNTLRLPQSRPPRAAGERTRGARRRT